MTRRPAFQFYPDNFLAGTNGMSRAAVGAYISMLCIAWGTGPIANTPRALWKAMSLGPDDPPFDAIWPEVQPKWVLGPDGWTNPRLEQVRADQDRYIAQQRAHGLRGGRPKHANGVRVAFPNPLHKRKGTETSSSSSSSSSSLKKDQCADARPSHAVLTKLAHGVFDDRDRGTLLDLESELANELKTRAAQAHLPYNGRAITKALDAARAQRAKSDG